MSVTDNNICYNLYDCVVGVSAKCFYFVTVSVFYCPKI